MLWRTLLALLVLSACSPAKTATPCPEARQTRCLTRVECSYDERRDCEVCRCAPPTQEPVPLPK